MEPYSMDLRVRVLADRDCGMSARDVAAKYRVSPAWVRRLLQVRRETGRVAPAEYRHGPPPSWVPMADRIREAVAAEPDATLDEYRARHGLTLGRATLARAMRVLRLTRKKSRCGRRSATAPP